MSNLLGRLRERQTVDRLLADARAGRSGVLVVRGDAGIGKTALLTHMCDIAASERFRVETSTGAEAEAQFAFAGLHQFCAPFLDHVSALPQPQQTALGVALGMSGGPTPDRFLVGLATLNLIAEAAEEQPLLSVVDDAQWLDRASAEVLAFVARRVDAERLALVFGERLAGSGESILSGLPELSLKGLSRAQAHKLLDTALRAPLDDDIREQIIAEARGNPLALLELPTSVPASRLAGGFQLPDLPDLTSRVESGFRRRSSDLPAASQLFLLAAAAEPTGDPELLHRASAELGLAPADHSPAEAAGLIELDSRVRFRHPLVRSAIYHAASRSDRRRVHSALAAVTDAELDPDRHAWHLSQAATGTDEAVAAALEHSAGRARARGGYAAAGAFLRRSTELTPDAAERTRRALDAASALHTAGASEEALDLLGNADDGSPHTLEHARAEQLQAQINFHLTRGPGAPKMLMDAATTLARFDPAQSRATYLHALDAAIITGDPDAEVIARAALSSSTEQSLGKADMLLEGLATTMVHGFAAGVPLLRIALDQLRDATGGEDAPEENSQPWLWLAGRLAVGILDEERAYQLTECEIALSRSTGALSRLPAALNLYANILTIGGQVARSSELAAEAEAITESTGGVRLHHARAVLAGWRGDKATLTALNSRTLDHPRNPERGGEAAMAYYASAVLHNGLGEYHAAKQAAWKACSSTELSLSTIGLSEMVEAATRAGDPEGAALAHGMLRERAHASATPLALGLEARCRALTSSGDAAEQAYLEALAHLSGSRIGGEVARSHLLYGEWLRREGRRQDARAQLRTAEEMLSEMGIEAFATRAANELHATGEAPRMRAARPSGELTAQELHIARLVATGATSREIGTQLFLSPRTIESHLRSIFRKVGITSRRQLKELNLA